ncbi:MAG: D-alanyl-D-alanine carboxypeptidase family protein [Parvularculaceae bacterium]
MKPAGNPDYFGGSRDTRLHAANNLAQLGAFYSMRENGRYAAAGLLASALAIRSDILGPDHPDTVQIALILGPVYQKLGRLEDAEKLYLDAFHAQEKVKGSNSPELSLYIKLLADVYQAQGRATEAQALNDHMRGLFRDAFGSQRYAANRERDRKLDIDRPVSQQFVLRADYAPDDLVGAALYSVPLSKNAGLDEMKVRLAADMDEDPREANLPVRLAQLMSLCRADSGERISLRSGYRAYKTQKDLFERIGYKGTVTPPGMSEHQLGLAADIDVNGRLMRQSDKTYQCFEENAFRFGFILSYPPDNDYLPGEDSYEPWHWRYVGIRTAQLYREAGPMNKPQEFLAALPCYQELAVSGGFNVAGEKDRCLEPPSVVAASAERETEDKITRHEAEATARKLNNLGQGGQR